MNIGNINKSQEWYFKTLYEIFGKVGIWEYPVKECEGSRGRADPEDLLQNILSFLFARPQRVTDDPSTPSYNTKKASYFTILLTVRQIYSRGLPSGVDLSRPIVSGRKIPLYIKQRQNIFPRGLLARRDDPARPGYIPYNYRVYAPPPMESTASWTYW